MNKLGFGFLRLPVKKGSSDDIDLDLLDHILTKHPEVEIVLSGMNTMAQLLDNLKERKPLIPEEQARLMQAAPRNFLSQTIFAGSANISITDQISLFH